MTSEQMLTMKVSTVGRERDGRSPYYTGQCFCCYRQFVSDYDELILVGHVKFCVREACERAAWALAERHG